MSVAPAWLWNGDAVVPLEAARGDGTSILHVEQTLVERTPSPLALVARGRLDGDGTHVVVTTGVPSNRLRVDAARCLSSMQDRTTQTELLLPLVAEMVGALERADVGLGWNAVVSGNGLRAALLLRLAPAAGARHVLALRDAASPATSLLEPSLTGEPAQLREALTEQLATARGPVLACDTSGDPAWLQTLLAALPAGSVLALFGHAAPPAEARVNVYRDVHRKNVRIVSAPIIPDAAVIERARRLLANGRIEASDVDFPVHDVALGDTPIISTPWAVLDWRQR